MNLKKSVKVVGLKIIRVRLGLEKNNVVIKVMLS